MAAEHEPAVTAVGGSDPAAAEPAAAPGRGGAAFFDLDKTLMQGSSAFQFGRAAYQAGLLSRRQLLSDARANVRFRLHGSSDEDSMALRDRIAASLAGVRVVELERLGVPVLAGILPRVYPEMLKLAHEHQDAGRKAYIVTAASQELADILATVMSFDGAIGSDISAVDDGVYTGTPVGRFAYGSGKAEALADLAAAEGIELADSYAYSDSASDLPMLETVGHPVAVNPDTALADVARDRGWPVIHLDRLGRRLKAGVVVAAAAGAGGLGGAAIVSRVRGRRRRALALGLRR